MTEYIKRRAAEPQDVRNLHLQYSTYAETVPAGPKARTRQDGGGNPASHQRFLPTAAPIQPPPDNGVCITTHSSKIRHQNRNRRVPTNISKKSELERIRKLQGKNTLQALLTMVLSILLTTRSINAMRRQGTTTLPSTQRQQTRLTLSNSLTSKIKQHLTLHSNHQKTAQLGIFWRGVGLEERERSLAVSCLVLNLLFVALGIFPVRSLRQKTFQRGFF